MTNPPSPIRHLYWQMSHRRHTQITDKWVEARGDGAEWRVLVLKRSFVRLSYNIFLVALRQFHF